MRRRSYLALTASALSAAAAGCTSAGDGGTDSTTSTTTATTTTTTTTTRTETTPAVSVSLSEVTLQPAALALQTDYLTVHDAGQYLFVDAAVENGSVEYDEYRLRVAGETYTPMTGQNRRRLWRMYNAGNYNPDAGGLVAFEFPGSTDASDPAAVIEHPGGERELGADLRSRIAAAPEFAFEMSVPDTVQRGGELAVAVSVTNESDRPARFVGGLNRAGPQVAMMPVAEVRPLVPAGETKTLTVDQSAVTAKVSDDDVGDGEADADYTLNTVAGSREATVRVVSESE